MLKTNSITTKIVYILVLMILPLNIISLMTAQKAQKVIIGQAGASAQSILGNSLIYLDTRIKESNIFLFDLISNDPKGITFYNQKGDPDYINAKYYIAQKIQKNMAVQNSADIYFAYSVRLDDMLICKNPVFTFPRNDMADELIRLHLGDGYAPWKLITFDHRQWLLHTSFANGMYWGNIFCIDTVISEIQQQLTYENVDFRVTNSPSDSGDHRDKLLLTGASSNAPLYIHIALDTKEILSTLPFFERIGFSLTLIYLLLIPVLFLILNRILLRPLKKISSAMARLRSGDKDYRIGTHKYSREFIDINETFNTMADSIEQLKIETYEAALAQKKMELRNFQLQIRPHFLLNTFNLMFSLSQMDDRENLENTILYMSDYFRYIFRSNQDLESFRLELELIKNYLVVAEIRYPGRFTITYDIAPEMLEVRIPPLLIHNYVENIIRHALHEQTVVHITLRAALNGDMAEFEIADDGPGMDTNLARKINEGNVEVSEDNEHIGIINSYQRIRFFLGEDASLKVDTAPGNGCRIFIRFNIPQT